MNEKLPQRANRLENAEKRPSMEGRPVVENMILGNYGGVLVKVTFPRSESVAKIFMLIPEPTSEQGTKNVEKLMREASDEEEEKIFEETLDSMNSPLVFRNLEQMQRWFDVNANILGMYGPAQRKAIAGFLEIEDKED